MQKGFVNTTDGAFIYYEVQGEGKPIFLVHGFGCSNKFYSKNVPVLAKKYKVITIDMRGHGNSSKGIDGYCIKRLAQDIHEVIEYLGLENVMLMGWSLGGPTMLSYFKQFGKERGHLAGLGLIDMTPCPFSPHPDNCHNLRNYNAPGFNAFQQAYLANPKGFIRAFSAKIFKDSIPTIDCDWICKEMEILPPYLGVALYGDYCYNDFTDVLPTIDVPTLVLSADSGIFPQGLKQGQWVASQIPQGKFVGFEEGGHMMFYLEADKFNEELSAFVDAL
mgnify:FL=1